jgi:hypothetical protein
MGHGHVPGPDIDEIRGRLEQTRHLRLALDLLEETLPGPYASDGLLAESWALREKFVAAELTELRGIGQRDYLVIQPLAPEALAAKAAGAVKVLDDLRLVIRLT